MARSNINRGRQRREELQERAEESAQLRASRSAAEQLSLLDDRLGFGVGAVRERERLQGEIDEAESRQKKSRQDKSKPTKKRKRMRRER